MKRQTIPALLLAALFMFTAVGCNKGKTNADDPRKVGADDAVIWCVDGSEQVLQGTKYEDFTRDKSDSVVIEAVRNEYETANIIVSAKKDLAFEVSVTDFVMTSDASKKISKENVNIYTQKYMFVGKSQHGNGAPSGGYPDALIPQKNAVAYKANYVDEGKNGAAFLEFYIPKDAAAGKYTGTATVDLGKGKVNVPVSLTVYDYTLSDETHTKALFTVNAPNVVVNERDNSVSMLEKYTEFLIDYRVSSGVGFESGDGAVEAFVNRAYDYVANKGMSTIGLPSKGVNRGDSANGYYSVIDIDFTAEYVVALAVKSLENDYNLIDRCAFFNFWVDEPFCSKMPANAVTEAAETFDDMLKLSVLNFQKTDVYKNADGDKKIFADKLIDSINKIPDVITDYWDDDHNLRTDGAAMGTDYEGMNVTVCPKPDGYENAEYRAQYDTEFEDGTPREKWIYGCNTPKNPYVSYHLDDTLVSPTAFSWMMAQYNLTGTIYWSTVYWYGTDGKFLEDPYSSAEKGSGALGDGVLLYPGKMFGVDGPIGTTRLQSVRDGQEDYEIFYALRKAYKENGKNAENIIDYVAKTVTENAQLAGTSADYVSARKLLVDLAVAAGSPAKLAVESVTSAVRTDGMTEYTFTASAAEGATVKINGAVQNEESGVYTFKKTLEETANYVNFEAEKDGAKFGVSFYLGGKQEIFAASEFTETDVDKDRGVTSAYDTTDARWIVTFNANEAEGATNLFMIKHSSLSQIDANTASYRVFLFNYGDDSKYNVYAQYESSATLYTVSNGTLNSGENEIILNAFATNRGKVKQLVIEVGGTTVKVGIEKLVVYGG